MSKKKAKKATTTKNRAKTKNTKARKSVENAYSSWTGAAATSGREIFDTKTRKRLDLADFPEIEQYLPPISEDARVHFFVARVATISKKSSAEKAVVKLFVNRGWNDNLLRQLEDMDFTQVDGYRDRLISDVKLRIDAGEEWRADSFIEIFRDLNPPGTPTAKVVFTNRNTGQSISAFWCW